MALPYWTLIYAALFCLPPLTHARCDTTPALYQQFKSYRESLNTADRFEQISSFFSKDLSRYYTEKLDQRLNKGDKQRYLNQYWDNLNIGKDIVIVYRQRVTCTQQGPVLKLLAILNTKPDPRGLVDLWDVTVHFVYENEQWLIQSLEYEKNRSHTPLRTEAIVDNFITLP